VRAEVQICGDQCAGDRVISDVQEEADEGAEDSDDAGKDAAPGEGDGRRGGGLLVDGVHDGEDEAGGGSELRGGAVEVLLEESVEWVAGVCVGLGAVHTDSVAR
jgi:hypothetical protein